MQTDDSPTPGKRSPSSADIWLTCTAAPAQCVGVPPLPSSPYAEEGKTAHALAADVLNGKEPDIPDPEMQAGINVYTDYCFSLLNDKEVLFRAVEQRIESTLIPNMNGYLDFYAIYREENHGPVYLEVVDFKYGKGIPVAAERNRQMMCYLSLAHQMHPKVENFRMTIVQPRAGSGKPETVGVSFSELRLFEFDACQASRRREFKAGEHCRWCPANQLKADGTPYCEHLHQISLEKVQTAFNKPAEVNADWVARWTAFLDAFEGAKQLADTVKTWLLEYAKAGNEIPGWKVVAQRGNRRWTNERDEDWLIKWFARQKDKDGNALGKKAVVKTSILSPVQMEKVAPKELVAKHVVRPQTGEKLVRESAAGAPIPIKKTAEVFANDLQQVVAGHDLSFLLDGENSNG